MRVRAILPHGECARELAFATDPAKGRRARFVRTCPRCRPFPAMPNYLVDLHLLQRFPARSTLRIGNGLRGKAPARSALTPYICVLSIDSHI